VSGGMVTNATFGLMNAFGVENAILVASVETLWLLAFNVGFCAVIAAMFVLPYCSPFVEWPPHRTLHRYGVHQCTAIFIHVYTHAYIYILILILIYRIESILMSVCSCIYTCL
jgi:hypothetical protein